jgi:hypothetical protein
MEAGASGSLTVVLVHAPISTATNSRPCRAGEFTACFMDVMGYSLRRTTTLMLLIVAADALAPRGRNILVLH